MSGFEIAHLKQCLKRSEAREHRQEIVIKALLHYGVSTRSRCFQEYMDMVPDNMIPTHPWYQDVQKFYHEFAEIYDAWVKQDDDTTFQEYLKHRHEYNTTS